jgi:hypothetical protein
MSLSFYRILHFSSIMLLFFGLGAVLVSHYSAGGIIKVRARILAFATHGFGLVFILISGFGMLAKLNLIQTIPLWAYAKLAIWILLGFAISAARRRAGWAYGWTLVFLILGVTAAYLGEFKPV